MSDQRVHRIVLVQPGANAQFTRRLHGIGRILNCETDVVTDIKALDAVSLRDRTTVVISKDSLARSHFDVSKVERLVEYDEHPSAAAIIHDERQWKCIGNPLASPHTPSILQLLLDQSSQDPRWAQIGWSSVRFSVECNLKTQAREIARICKALRLSSTPSLTNFLSAIRQIQAQSHYNSASHTEIWCDGNTFCFEWKLDHIDISSSDTAHMFHEIPNSLHVLRYSARDNQNSICISGRFQLGQALGRTKGIVIVGTLAKAVSVDNGDTLPLGESA